MGFFSLWSASLQGIHAHPVRVEVDVSFGLPRFHIVGLPDTAVQESRDRIRTALQYHEYPFPKTVITVNLAPAHIKKQGSHHDTAIALAILAAERCIPHTHLGNVLIAGELGLSGELRPVRGIVPLALFARKQGLTHIIVAREDANITQHIPDLITVACATLADVVHLLQQPSLPKNNTTSPSPALAPTLTPPLARGGAGTSHPLAHIRGQELAKRALTIAIAGRHPLLFVGPPGSGKTLLAKSARYLAPELTFPEMLDRACIASVRGEQEDQLFSEIPPFRSPHHHTSTAALIGGGSTIQPGEVSLAHHGILFLDELPEFPQKTLEALRQPLEDGDVHIARASGRVTFPAQFHLIAAMNPCPCGYAGDPVRSCTCSAQNIRRYQERLSGPLLDRIDLFVDVQRITGAELTGAYVENPELPTQGTLRTIRDIQQKRARHAEGKLPEFERIAHIVPAAKTLLARAIDRLHLSGRAYARLLRTSRTIADLAQSETVEEPHVSEALSYRSRLLRDAY